MHPKINTPQYLKIKQNRVINLLASLNLLEIQIMTQLANSTERDPITHRFIGHAMKVHSLVGPGLQEEIYHQELVAALQKDGIEHRSKPRRELIYRGSGNRTKRRNYCNRLSHHANPPSVDQAELGHRIPLWQNQRWPKFRSTSHKIICWKSNV